MYFVALEDFWALIWRLIEAWVHLLLMRRLGSSWWVSASAAGQVGQVVSTKGACSVQLGQKRRRELELLPVLALDHEVDE
jgi:hypothetical protein